MLQSLSSVDFPRVMISFSDPHMRAYTGTAGAHFSLPAIWLCMTCGCQNVVFEYLNLTFICLPTQVSGTCKLLYVLMFSCFMLRHGISSLRVHSADLFGRVAGCNHASVFSG